QTRCSESEAAASASLLRHPCSAQTGDISVFEQGADLRHPPITGPHIADTRKAFGCRRDLRWNLIPVSDRRRIRGQAARSIGLSASFWVRLCHPSTLRIVI